MYDRLITTLLGLGVTADARVRGWYRRILLSQMSRSRRLKVLLLTPLWPGVAIGQAARVVRRYGSTVAAHNGPSRPRQFVQQAWLAIRLGIDAEAYYRYRWFLPERRRRAPKLVPSRRLNRLLLGLARRESAEDAAILDNKDRFFDWCREHGLGTIPILATFHDGAIETSEPVDAVVLPPRDLFVKPSDSRWGFGARIWPYRGGGYVVDPEGTIVGSAEALSLLARQSKHPTFGKAASVDRAQQSRILVQERLHNHPDLADLTVEALCTVRLITARSPAGRIEGIAAAFRMASATGPVDNMSDGGMVADVDMASGRLSHAVLSTPQRCSEFFDHHPHTGGGIAGRVLPFWAETVALALRAHAATDSIAFVGWDIAICADGPVLVEANVSWGADLMQIATGTPLGATPFVPWYLMYMERAWRRERADAATENGASSPRPRLATPR